MPEIIPRFGIDLPTSSPLFLLAAATLPLPHV